MQKMKAPNIQVNLGIFVIPRFETNTYRKKASVSENSKRNSHIKFNSARSSPRGIEANKITKNPIQKFQVGKLFQKSSSFQNLSKDIKQCNISQKIDKQKNVFTKIHYDVLNKNPLKMYND